MPAALRHLTIKPTHRCMHRCPYCDSRRQLLRMSHDVVLGVDDWRQVFAQADELGTEYLDISGGEPVLDAALPALVWEGKRRGWFVSLNSTGWGLPGTIDELVRVCLDQVVLSLMSLDPARHDAARGTPGSWTHFRRAVECLRGRPVRLVLHFILARQNHGELPELIDFAFANGASAVALAYPECDSANRRLLMSADDVAVFAGKFSPKHCGDTRRIVRGPMPATPILPDFLPRTGTAAISPAVLIGRTTWPSAASAVVPRRLP